MIAGMMPLALGLGEGGDQTAPLGRSVVGGLALATLFADEFPGKRIFYSILLMPMMVVPAVAGYMFFMLFQSGGPVNDILSSLTGSPVTIAWLSDPTLALFAVMVADIWQWTPLMFLILLAGLVGVPEDQIKAATLLGANPWQRFVTIVLPKMKTIIIIALAIRVIENFKIFDTLYIMTGGGPGVMEAANRGAFEARELSVGLNIDLPHEQEPNPYITPDLCFQFHYFAMRKFHFVLRAAALVVFPGGFGTLDELFDTLCLRQTRRMQQIPVILYGRKYWDSVINFQHLADEGVIDDEDLKLIDYAETPQEAWQIIAKFHGLQ